MNLEKLGQNVPREREFVSRALRSMKRKRNDALRTRDPCIRTENLR